MILHAWIRLFSLVAILCLMLSCSLPLAKAPAAGSNQAGQPQPTQPGSGSSVENKPEATSSASGNGAPQAEKTAQANRSNFKGGISARDGYVKALPEAQKWNSHAVLSGVGAYAINPQGLSKEWSYLFADDTLKLAADRKNGFIVIVGEKGVTSAKSGDINIVDRFIPADEQDWLIDSAQAVATCEQAGGSRLRADRPAVAFSADLSIGDYPPGDKITPQRSAKNIVWNINYGEHSAAGNYFLNCAIDGNTGKLFELSSSLDLISTVKPITAMTGYKMALAKAQEWNPGATLITARPYDSNNKLTLKDGTANAWTYIFIVLPEPQGANYQPAFEVTVSSEGLTVIHAHSDYAGHAAVGSQSDWLIDSDAVFATAEENGGKAFCEQHPDCKHNLWINLAFTPVETLNTSKNVRWSVTYYLENDEQTSLQLTIDGTTGKIVNQK